MARKTPPLSSKAPTSDALAPDIETHTMPLDSILERLEQLEESLMRDRAAAAERLLGSESLIAALIAKTEFLERRLESVETIANDVRTQQMAIAQAEPSTVTPDGTSAAPTAAQFKSIEHKLHLLNNSIGAY
jgi:hypothetical protein